VKSYVQFQVFHNPGCRRSQLRCDQHRLGRFIRPLV